MTGLLFAQHGAQKLLGVIGGFRGRPGATADLFTQHWFAGVLELFGGLLFAAGLFTSPIAFVLSGLMAVAYFKAHAPDGFWPLLNRGELAALYCFVFFAFWTLGGGRYSVDGILARRRS
jgi:putative oxidoreductase